METKNPETFDVKNVEWSMTKSHKNKLNKLVEEDVEMNYYMCAECCLTFEEFNIYEQHLQSHVSSSKVRIRTKYTR